jgi:hypothetical protein
VPTQHTSKAAPEVAHLAARAVARLGYEPVIVVGRGQTSDGKIIGHVWVEIPELDLGIETNPSQMRGISTAAAVFPLVEFEDYERFGVYPDVLDEIGPGFERLFITEAAERFYNKLAVQVAACVRR